MCTRSVASVLKLFTKDECVTNFSWPVHETYENSGWQPDTTCFESFANILVTADTGHKTESGDATKGKYNNLWPNWIVFVWRMRNASSELLDLKDTPPMHNDFLISETDADFGNNVDFSVDLKCAKCHEAR